MKKFLFILLLLPAIAALGHDVYFFTMNQDKGFRLSDLGKLWDTYHKESHDQWKIKIDELSESVNEVIGTEEQPAPPVENATQEQVTAFQEGFTQEDSKNGTVDRLTTTSEVTAKSNASTLKNSIGFLLEQKAVFVLGAIPAIAFILNALIGAICRPRRSKETKSFKPAKGKKLYKRK